MIALSVAQLLFGLVVVSALVLAVTCMLDFHREGMRRIRRGARRG